MTQSDWSKYQVDCAAPGRQVHVQKHAEVVAGPEPEAKSSLLALTSDFANGIFIAPCPVFRPLVWSARTVA